MVFIRHLFFLWLTDLYYFTKAVVWKQPTGAKLTLRDHSRLLVFF